MNYNTEVTITDFDINWKKIKNIIKGFWNIFSNII